MQTQKMAIQSSLTQTSKSCVQSILILKKVLSEQKKNYIQFDFLNISHKGGSQIWSVSQFLPVFNTDKKFYTPTFILKVDQPKYEIRDVLYRSLHRNRIQSNLDQQTSQLNLPKPFKFNCYCTICKIQFKDYLKHTNCKVHIQKMRSSQYCQDISKLCSRFGNDCCTEQERKKIPKTKKIEKLEKQFNFKVKC